MNSHTKNSTLRTLLKRDAIVNQTVVGGTKKKKIKTAKFEDMEKIIPEWFAQALAMNIPISGLLIQDKASEVAAKMGLLDCNASNGWMVGSI